MKKIFLLMLIMGVFSPLINAYEILISSNDPRYIKFYTDEHTGKLQYLEHDNRNNTNYYTNPSNGLFISALSNIKFNQLYYINKNEFENYFVNNQQILNDFYLQATQQILNYFYNNNSFNGSNYLRYENYELLYNSDGLAVESIVNGVWAGLYEDGERGVSGRLYSSGGQLLYVNGKPINWMESQLIKLMDMVENSLLETVAVLGSLVPVIVAAVFVLLILYYVVSVGRRAIMPSNVKVRKRFLGSHNDEC